MIDPAFASRMARYNRWQNRSLYGAAEGLSDAARREDRGAFFGSIHGTLSHLLWGDTTWMSRFDGWEKPDVPHTDSPRWIADWADLAARRAEADGRILDWAEGLDAERLAGDLTWYSGISKSEMKRPMALCVVHFFNHQTHHRGQVHAMLTAAGARPDDTDLFIMPDGV
ncbi:DinB family protein [Silicimonas algicola]|nr:DinB family protein [Silicimonas algicola]